MATFKNLTVDDTGYIQIPSGTTAQRPASPVEGMMRYNTSLGYNEYYNGTSWVGANISYTPPNGSSSGTAALSASDILYNYPTSSDGVYWINLPTVGATQIYCIMNRAYNGGGWMMGMKAANTGTTFNYSATYWTTINTLNPSDNTRNNADAKFNTFNYFGAKDIMAVWPDIATATYGAGSISGVSEWTWLENSFNNGTRQTLTGFFTTPSNRTYTNTGVSGDGYFIKDAKTFSGWKSGVFSSQVDIRFYGFNYLNESNSYGINAKVRWGFGWNENGEGLFPASSSGAAGSNDVSGGIGMDTSFGSYSAGDKINCCQDTTGINRQARVEIYLR